MILGLGTLSKVFALISFILSVLCLFAGSQRGFLESASVMTVSIATSEYVREAKSDMNCSSTHLGPSQRRRSNPPRIPPLPIWVSKTSILFTCWHFATDHSMKMGTGT